MLSVFLPRFSAQIPKGGMTQFYVVSEVFIYYWGSKGGCHGTMPPFINTLLIEACSSNCALTNCGELQALTACLIPTTCSVKLYSVFVIFVSIALQIDKKTHQASARLYIVFKSDTDRKKSCRHLVHKF